MHKTFKLSVLVIILFPAFSFGQYDNYSFREMFFGRPPNARAEAMGKAFASIDGDISTVFFNPAGTATIRGLEVNTSFASPYYLLPELKFNYFGLAYHFNKYLTVGLSRNQNNYGMMYLSSLENPELIADSGIMTNNVYTLNISSQPFKNLFVGANVNYMVYGFINPIPKTLFFDFGVIKKFHFQQNNNFQQSINIAANICNLNYAKMTFEEKSNSTYVNKYSYSLPVITRYAANYQFVLKKHFLVDTLNTLEFLAQAECNDLLNSDYLASYHFGVEVKLLEILSLRAGYYHQKVDDFGNPSYNKDFISSFTYGFGIQLPFYKLIKLPVNINFDYTSLPQPTYTKNKSDRENFTSYSFRLNWRF
jgi:hypothetical protein